MGKIWAIADLHLAFSVPEKSMEVFGPAWKDYAQKLKKNWEALVSKEDLVLIPGDISWATHLEEALIDLKWIDTLPGTKLILKGNHDYWWPSPSRLKEALPPTIHYIQNNSFDWGDATFGGVRLWDTEEYNFDEVIEFKENPFAAKKPRIPEEEKRAGDRKIFERDLKRLRLSLDKLNPKASFRVALLHYPPIGADLKESATSLILEEYKIDLCVFGHLHNVREGALPFGTKNGVRYLFVSADYLDFKPVLARS